MNCVDSVMSYNTQTWEINKELFSQSSEVQTAQDVHYLYLTSENVWETPKVFLCKSVILPWSSEDSVSPMKWKKIWLNFFYSGAPDLFCIFKMHGLLWPLRHQLLWY